MALESPIQRDGDVGFIGYSSRVNPVTLPAGMLQISENMRLDRGVAVTRRGAKRMLDDVNLTGTPLTIPFNLSATPEVEATNPVIESSYAGGIFASEVMRSPDDTGSIEIIILAGPDRAYTFLNSDELTNTSMAWSSGVIAVDGTDNLVTENNDELVVTNLQAEITFPSSPDEIIEPSDKVSMMQAFDRLYLFREADVTRSGWGTLLTNSLGISVAGSWATVNVDGHGFSGGTRVRIDGSTSPAFDGHEYDISSISTDSFTIAVPSGTTPDASANIKVRRVKPPLYWSGVPGDNFVRPPAGIPDVGISYRRMRSAPWANYINNRIIVPDGRQNVMLSDVFDPDTFDTFWSSFRVGVGGNDKIMAVHPWIENSFLVFCRKSIWLATVGQTSNAGGNDYSIDTAVSRLDLLTDEIGCCARRTIATAGQFIYFLSDSGVYRLDSRLDLKLRGDTKPLSDPISDQIASLNSNIIEDSVGLYFDNRYYVAVPLAGSIDSNNGVFIYNQLQEAWETRDTYGVGVNNFLVSDYGQRRRIFITNRSGKLMLLDEVEAGDESPSSSVDITSPVPGRIVTRRYGMGSMDSKRFVRSLADVVVPDGGSLTVSALTYNPDRTRRTGDILPDVQQGVENTSGNLEDYTLKQSIRRKAHYAEIEFLTTAGRPEIRNVSIEAALASLPQTETRNTA